jgi:hypothetical protein
MRALRKEEQELIAFMLRGKPDFSDYITNQLPHSIVEEMNDGGMGSLKFLSVKDVKSIMKDEVARIDLRDIDGINLSITININTDGEIYELDVFKGDSSPLKQFPVAPYIW